MLVAIALLTVGHWGWFYPDHCSVPNDTTALGLVHYELSTSTVGTTAKQELLPRTVRRLVEPDTLPLVWQERLNPVGAAANVRLIEGSPSLLRDEMILEADAPTTLQYRRLYFPGWQVLIDGTAVPVTPSDPEGWLQFEVPDGRHTLTVRFAETPAWLLADWLSVLAVLATITLALRGKTGERRFAYRSGGAGERRFAYRSRLALLVLAVGLLGVKGWVVDRQLVWPHEGRGVVIERPSSFTFGGPSDPAQIRLLGHSAITGSIPVNEPLALRLVWQTVAPTNNDYRVGLTLVDEHGLRWSEEGLRDDR